MELVSIIVPVYNTERYLNECIDSLIEQTYKNIEIILVDDGSVDKCPIICDEYAEKDSRIVSIHKVNGGMSSARNVGIRKANGNWIMFVDSDDWIAKDSVEKLLQIADEATELIIFDFQKAYNYNEIEVAEGSGKTVTLSECEIENIIIDIFDPMEEHFKMLHGCKVPCWSKFYKASLLKENNIQFFEDLRIHEDIPFAAVVCANAKKIKYVNLHIYQYRHNMNSIMNSYRENYVCEMDMLLDKMNTLRTFIKDNDLSKKLYYDRVASSIINLIIRYFCHNDNKKNYHERKSEYEMLLCREPYRTMLFEIKTKNYSPKKKLATLLIKIRKFWIIEMVFYILNSLHIK